MLNNNQGGLDPSNARTFGNQFGTGQGQGGFPMGGNLAGLHNIPTSYNLQNTLPQNRGLGGLPAGGNQQQQSRFGAQNLPSSLQQYSQVANRGGLPVMNGLNNPGVGRGAGANPNIQVSRAQGAALSGLSGLGPSLQRQPQQGIPGLSNLAQRGMPNLGLGAGGGHLGVQQLGSPARSTAMGLGYPGMGQAGLANSHQPSGDLLAMINKTGGASQLSNFGSLNQSFGGQQQQGVQGNAVAGQAQGQEKEQPAFDASEFPALGGGLRGNVGLANGDSSGTLEGSNNLYANLGMQKGMLPSEFNIQSEEFPALPGANASSRTGGEDSQQSDQQQQQAQSNQSGHLNLRQEGDGARSGQMLYEQAVQGQAGQQPGANHEQQQLLRYYQMQQQQARFPAGLKGGLGGAPGYVPQAAQNPAAKLGSMQGAAQPDRFGLLGLLSVIRMTDPDLTTLALGTDLTTLGLHLNSPDNVYKTFASPWADQPLKPEPDYKVPACYRQPAPRLKPGYFSKFQQDTLFYIFYSMPADEAQVFAADELASRGWWFHKELKSWLTRAPNAEPSLKAAHMERGSYLVFDTSVWDVVRKDNFLLNYEQLERPPSLPRPGIQPANAQPNLPPK